MQLKIYKDYHTLSSHAADEIIELVKNKPDAVLCLAAGDTPRLAYSLLVKKAKDENVNFKQCVFIGLDEWVGIPPSNEGSCAFFLQTHIFKPLEISPAQIHLFNSLSSDLEWECREMDKTIAEKGGIDLMLVGVGMNGHIGFNEPGISVDKYSHVTVLDATSQSVGQKYFTEPTDLHHGITLGLKHLLESNTVIMMANGSKKSTVIRKALEEQITIDMPASIIRTHSHSIIMVDEEAASLLKNKVADI